MELRKSEIIARGLQLGVDYGLTLSCYDPGSDGAACGHCDACQLRRTGFRDLGLTDPARYQAP
jgi:7-cyano-7-deazaguanine synthase